ncbi:MAG: TaqI-like C-terminal specificity domain-containing protein [Candidatus Peribacteraceae bacterium]|nr:TaqI-like C-terminal specificity domain-containing protein [Candidatus Peribacteraceae bacterium]
MLPATKLLPQGGTWSLADSVIDIGKILEGSIPLGKIGQIIVGIKPYQTGKGVPKQTKEIGEGKVFTSDRKVDDTYIRCVIGKDFHRYVYVNEPSMYLSYGKWLAEPRETAPFFKEKIIIRQTSDSLIAHLDSNKWINLNNVYNVAVEDENYSNLYVLSLLNSKLMNCIYQFISQEKGKTFAEVKKVYLEKLPIKPVRNDTRKLFEIIAQKIIQLSLDLNKRKQNFYKLLKAEFGLSRLPKKMDSFFKMNYEEFIKALGVKLSMLQKAELIDIFENNKKILSALFEEIQSLKFETDKQICTLYELTNEERAVVLETSTS